MAGPIIQLNGHGQHPLREETTPNARKTLHQNVLVKLRPLPFQYHWTVWFDKHIDPPSTTSIQGEQSQQHYSSRLTVLYEDISDIATFYRVYNNYPWDRIRLRDTVHIFRKGVQPVWEDPENVSGGCWTFRVPKIKGQDFFHEVVILAMANELQAAIESEHDHVLGVSISTRFNSYLISVWNKHGFNENSIRILERTIIVRLSPHLRPVATSSVNLSYSSNSTIASPPSSSYFYKRHSEHEGYKEAVARAKHV